MILASSKPGDLVCDLFSGSGTTAAAAMKLGRRFLALDVSPLALYTLRARLLKAASTHSFLEGDSELVLRYPADETPAECATQIVNTRGRRMLQLEQASFSPDYPLVYGAVGTAENGEFCPVATDCRPKLPLSLPIRTIDRPVVQFTDALGRTAFFEIEN